MWLNDVTARLLHAAVGDRVSIAAGRARVAGIYRDLAAGTPRPFWCSYGSLIYELNYTVDNPTTHLILATDPATLMSLVGGFPLDYADWLAPVRTDGLTLSEAGTINADETRAERELAPTAAVAARYDVVLARQAGANQQALPDMTATTALTRRGLTGTVAPVGIAGSALALLLMAAAGSLWTDRRAREVRLLSARGVGPVAMGAKAATELVVPALFGSAIGLGIAVGVVRLLGPSPRLDAAAPGHAAITAAAGFVAGVVMVATVAGLRSCTAIDEPARRVRMGFLPWEVLVLAVAAALYLRLRGETAVTLVNGVAQVNLLLVVFPLLFLLGALVLFVRAVGWLLPMFRRASHRWPIAGYLAVRRVSGSALVSLTLLAAAGLPVAVFIYSGAITATTRDNITAKALDYAGAPTNVYAVDRLHTTPALDQVATIVTRYTGADLGAQQAEVLAINPATFAAHAYYERRFATPPLATLLHELAAQPPHGRLPAIVLTAESNGSTTLHLGATTRRLDVIARPIAFPGQQDPYSDFVVVDSARLGRADPSVAVRDEAWSRQSATTVERAITTQGARVLIATTPHSVVDATHYVVVTWTFDYLQALGVLIGLIALGGLLLYLATRQRSRVAEYALARRMGLRRTSHIRSVLIELGALLTAAWLLGTGLAWLASLLVYRDLDVDPTQRPPPALLIPVAAFAGSAATIVIVTTLASWTAQRAADRANISDVMRLDA